MHFAQNKARKLELKKQSLQIRGIDREDKIHRSLLREIRRSYEKEIDNRFFDRELSKKIDCLNFLMEA